MPKRSRGPLILILILIIVLVLAGAAVGFFLMRDPERRIRRQLSLGDKYYAELDYDRAIAAYSGALEIDPRNEDALYGIAHSYQDRGEERMQDGSDDYYDDFAAAKDYYEQAITYYPDSDRAGEAQEEIDRIEEIISGSSGNTADHGQEPAGGKPAEGQGPAADDSGTRGEGPAADNTGSEGTDGENLWTYEDIEEQLKLIADNYSQWNRIDPNEVPTSGFTVADLNNNGRVEIIVSGVMGTGIFSETYVFEVNEDHTGLMECSFGEEFSPDIVNVQSAEIYRVDQNYMMICDDSSQQGWQDYYRTRQSLSLQNNSVVIETLGTAHRSNSSDGTSKDEYSDRDGNPISEEEFNDLPAKIYPGSPKGEITFKWIYLTDAQPDGLDRVREAWEGFSCSLFYPKAE